MLLKSNLFGRIYLRRPEKSDLVRKTKDRSWLKWTVIFFKSSTAGCFWLTNYFCPVKQTWLKLPPQSLMPFNNKINFSIPVLKVFVIEMIIWQKINCCDWFAHKISSRFLLKISSIIISLSAGLFSFVCGSGLPLADDLK